MGSTSFLVTYLLPGALAFIMFGLGLTLKVEDFTRIVRYPKSVILGLVCQMFILPVVAFALCYAFKLDPQLSIGLMILAASPGGATANLFSHLAHGDVALNLTLTAINSVLAAVTLPLIVNFALGHFSSEGQTIGLQFQKVMEVFVIVLLPVTFGMFIHKVKPDFSRKMDKPVRAFSFLVLLVIVAGAIAKERHSLLNSFSQVGVAVFIFNIVSLGVGYVLPIIAKVKHREAIAISMEVGIHNGTLAIYVALSLLNSYELALPAAIYSIMMFITAAIFSYILVKKNKGEMMHA